SHAKCAPAIERAFSKDYKESFVNMVSEYARHFRENGWNRTRFQFYLNNKYYAKENENGTAWWLFDEPAHRDDFLALAFFGKLFWEGVRTEQERHGCNQQLAVSSQQGKENTGEDSQQLAVSMKEKAQGTLTPLSDRSGKPNQEDAVFDFRVDISRPQYQRGMLDGLASLEVVSNVFFTKNRLCVERSQKRQEYWFYGGGPQIEEPSSSLVGLYYQAYLLGADGGLPYYTSFCRPCCWHNGEYLAIIYPGTSGPIAGLRLKMERRAVQDIEYMTLLAVKDGWSRDKVNKAVLKKIRLEGKISSKGADDPGKITFSHLKPDDFNRLRIAVANTLLMF
ncbi:MAG: hypothetical protein AAB110_01280, partial [Candidatus Desantisbacteria bacterium]